MKIIIRALILVLSLARSLVWLVIFAIMFGYFLTYVQNVSKYTYLSPIIKNEKKLNSTVKEYIPTKVANKDMSRPLTILLLLIVSAFISRVRDGVRSYEDKHAISAELVTIKKQAKTKEQREAISELQSRVTSAADFTGKTRQQLLEEFVTIKKELEKTGRSLAFLAIDVVDSTGMKVGEDSKIVENDFNLYHGFVTNKFKENGFLKAAWTPDGVMACFNTIEQAISAARAIIKDIPDIIQNIKSIKRDFMDRCGINAGFVYYDLSTPLEEFSDRVIDIAGHMQKHAKPNTIYVAKEIIEPIKTFKEFEDSKKIVDGFEVCEWKPE